MHLSSFPHAGHHLCRSCLLVHGPLSHAAGRGVVDLAAGAQHSLALADNGCELYAWGCGESGQLGLGRGPANTSWVPAPRRLRGGPLDSGKVKGARVVAGPYSSGLVSRCGGAWTWGHGGTWALGHGGQLHEFAPRQVGACVGCGLM